MVVVGAKQWEGFGGGPGGGPGEAVNGISQQPVTVKTIELRERVGKDKVKIRSINK